MLPENFLNLILRLTWIMWLFILVARGAIFWLARPVRSHTWNGRGVGLQRKCGMLLPKEVPGNVDKNQSMFTNYRYFSVFSFNSNTLPHKTTVDREIHLDQLLSCSPTPSLPDPSSNLPLTLGDTRLLQLCSICTCPNLHSKNKYYQERGL